jgi:hypothetical protein
MLTLVIVAVVMVAVGPSFFDWASSLWQAAKWQEEKERRQRKNGPYRP